MPKKKSTKKLIEVTPHKSLMLKVGQTGYSLQEAISELIDNSIDARIKDRKLKINLEIDSKSISITDNGEGMNEDEAMKSIRLGYSSKKGKLGEFGMGMKTASNFMGKKFTMITTKRGSKNEYIITFDEDEWMKKGDWTKHPFEIKHEVPLKNGGTTLIIEKLKIDINEKLINDLKYELSIRFGPFINSGEIKLVVNDEKAEPVLPKILGQKHKFHVSAGKYKASGWWAYQLQGLNKSYFGFNTFRRGRLITTFDKIGLNPNQSIKQIVGEINIEGVPISHDKKSWQKGTTGYKNIEELLRKYFVDFEPQLNKLLSGYPASRGIVEGEVKIINMFMSADMETEMNKINKGDVIVTEMTRPQFVLGIRRAGAIITDLGGSLCHAAIVSREFDIPAVVGTQIATKKLKSGIRVIVDANEGVVYEA